MDLILSIPGARLLVRRSCRLYYQQRESLRFSDSRAHLFMANFCELAESGFYDDTKFTVFISGFLFFRAGPQTLAR